MLNLLAKVALVLCFLGIQQATAQDIEIGTGLLCDTAQQVERYVVLTDQNPATALTAVNVEAKKENACAPGSVAYRRGRTVKTLTTKHGTYDIVEITVIAGVSQAGMMAITPTVQYTLFPAKGEAI